MTISPHIFRAYDIRGIAEEISSSKSPEITPKFARVLGYAFARFLSTEVGHAPRIVVGRDDRLTGEALSTALIAGLLAGEAEVVDIGYATSPYFYFAVCFGRQNEILRQAQDDNLKGFGFDGGINVTASHNPGEYNGFKLVRREAMPVAGEELQKLREMMMEIPNSKFQIPNSGKAKQLDFKTAYFQKLAQLAPLQRKLKVVIDCGNGTAGRFAPDFFRQLGCEVLELYCEPDGNFPNHPPNPEEVETLHDLQVKVREVGADLGIAYDGDGDRAGIVDERGEVIASDRLLVLLARDLLTRQPGATVIFDGKCSKVLAAEIVKAGGVPLRWKTGHSFIKQKMRETGALLAGEVSGHMFFGEDYYGVDDGLLASAKIVAILARGQKPLSAYFADLPVSFTTPEMKLPVPDAVKFPIMEKIKTALLQKYPGDTLDGVRVDLPFGWFLIRASNTSPCFTARAEADSAADLLTLKKILAEELACFPEVDAGALGFRF